MEASKFAFLHLYSSHMVLQRRKPVVFQGTAEKECEVTLTFHGQSVRTAADREGYWSAVFPALEAGGPYTVTLSGASGTKAVTLDDILVGEVWLCTGQSNMAMPVWSENPFWRAANADEEVRRADCPQLRLFQLPEDGLSPHRELRDLTQGSWQVCSPETVKAFSACGYFFGRQLLQDLHIPVGLINVSWGGTCIEAWLSADKLAQYRWHAPKDDDFEPGKAWEAMTHSDDYRHLQEWVARFNALGQLPPEELSCDFDDGSWERMSDRCFPMEGRQAVRFTFELEPRFAGQPAELKMSSVNDADTTFCNGQYLGETTIDTPEYWAANRDYAIPAGVLRSGRNVIAVLADNHFMNGLLPAAELSLVFSDGEVKIRASAKMKNVFLVPEDFPERPPAPLIVARHPATPNYPATLFNARVAPWKNVPMRGTIWYQGCNNNGEQTYYPLHKMLIDDFREQFNDPDFVFLLVQLAAYHTGRNERPFSEEEIAAFPVPEYSPYAITREIQSEMPHRRPGVGMVTAFDCGDAADIHPRDKQTLGARLARKAEAMCYQRPGVCDGPELDYCRFEEGKIRLFFRHTGSGLTTSDGAAPRGFRIGGAAGEMFDAEAVIEGDTVVVSAARVAYPQRVRYAFTGYCRVNLCNKEGLPALPFRTDKPDYEAMFPNVR